MNLLNILLYQKTGLWEKKKKKKKLPGCLTFSSGQN